MLIPFLEELRLNSKFALKTEAFRLNSEFRRIRDAEDTRDLFRIDDFLFDGTPSNPVTSTDTPIHYF